MVMNDNNTTEMLHYDNLIICVIEYMKEKTHYSDVPEYILVEYFRAYSTSQNL